MPISAPPKHLDGSLKTRQARPLNGQEVREAVETHLLTLTDRLLSNIGLLSDQIISLSEQLRKNVRDVFSLQIRLNKIHVTYPKVGWNIKTRVEQLEDHTYIVNAEVELDLERNVRLNLQFGESGRGIVISSLEDEKIPIDTPDKDRRIFGLPIEADYTRPDGTIGKVDIRELHGQKERARIAKTVDVGSGMAGREFRNVPAEIEVNGRTIIGTKEILMKGGEDGQEVILPSDLPEITLNDLIATPPVIPKEPPKTPLPPKGIGNLGRPNVKFKDSK